MNERVRNGRVRNGRGERERCAARHVARGVAAAAVFAGCAFVASAAAQEREAAPLSLWTSNAPIASVLEQVVGSEVFDVRVGEGVEGLVSGRLEGSVSEVLEPLLDRYLLTVHNDGSTVWFDRRDRDVVERVSIDPDGESAFLAWAENELEGGEPDREGRVERAGEELVIRGTRAYVQDALGRVAAARGALDGVAARERGERGAEGDITGEIESAVTSAVDADAEEAVAMPAEALAMPDLEPAGEDAAVADYGPPYRSVSDIPGFDTEYR